MEEIVKRLASLSTKPGTLRRDDFEASPHSGGSGETTVLTKRARQPFALRQGARYRVVPVARETFTSDGSGSQQTFNLSHDLIDSRVSEDLVLFADGSQVSEDSVDYDADSFAYTDGGSTEDLTVYYVAATQAQVKLRKVAPGGSNSETLVEHDAALINRRDPNRDPLEFNLDASPLQATVPKDWRLEWTVTGPFSAGWDPDTDPAPVNFLVSVPINRAQVAEVEGLASAVSADTSDRV
ncbi:MAG: hypothetical protein HQRvContig05_34 [Haloquadratum phage sp.]|nr:MAG: hypothetical protein HQRvContig05_34 [Haloquadratum phage sp.]